jgi:hypothetical protein
LSWALKVRDSTDKFLAEGYLRVIAWEEKKCGRRK